jgi:hypothetical protein
MKRTCTLVVLGLVACLTGTTLAQAQSFQPVKEQTDGERVTVEESIARTLSNSSGTNLTLNQQGQDNRSIVNQSTIGGFDNAVIVSQQGSTNQVNLTQTGAAVLSIIEQIGNRNSIMSDVEANTSSNILRQNGDDNRITQDIRTIGQSYQVEQFGNGNQLTQRENSTAGGVGYSVQMQGSGINIIIERGAVQPN